MKDLTVLEDKIYKLLFFYDFRIRRDISNDHQPIIAVPPDFYEDICHRLINDQYKLITGFLINGVRTTISHGFFGGGKIDILVFDFNGTGKESPTILYCGGDDESLRSHFTALKKFYKQSEQCGRHYLVEYNS